MASKANDRDFLPLTVDYRENTYSAGKIPGGFFKREGRPSEKEILTSRLIDRPMRPLFPDSWRNETQIIAMVLSADSDNDPDVIAVTAASAAAYCSDLPFENPSLRARRLARRQAGRQPDRGGAEEEHAEHRCRRHRRSHRDGGIRRALKFPKRAVVDALEFGHAQVKKIVGAIKELHDQLKPKKVVVEPLPFDQSIYNRHEEKLWRQAADALNTEKHPEEGKLSPR